MSLSLLVSLVCTTFPIGVGPVSQQTLQRVLAIEEQRIATVARVSPAVVAIFDQQQSGGGSGVLIDEHGYGLTNFHVVMGMMKTRTGLGGLSDGKLYTLKVLGIDITGDVAMFRLVGRDSFPFAELGDSDTVDPGDQVIAMGNPFILAEDYSPTVTTGIVTGIHRYQGESDTLVYTDAIQTDAAINPGNSGGPLFDEQGRVIGINGRISAEMHKYARGRFNVGLGYAITINQIKRFIPALRAGLLAKHGTLLATVRGDDSNSDGVVFDDLYEDAPAWNAGIRVGNRLLRFGDVDIHSANQFLSILGTYPQRWPVPITFDRFGEVVHKVVRLEGVTPPMRGEYVVPEDVHAAAVKRAIGGMRKSVFGKQRAVGPRRWTYDVVRTDEQGDRTKYTVVSERGRRAIRAELDESGAPARRIEFDNSKAFYAEHEKRFSVDPVEALYYAADYALRWQLLGNDADWMESDLQHVGGDALVAIDDQGHITRERMLEAVALPLSEHVSLQVSLEVDSLLPARLFVRDAPTGLEVEIELSDYQTEGGVRMPHTWTVRSAGRRFQETISNLKTE